MTMLSLMPALMQPEVERIHAHSLELLDRVGVKFNTRRALTILREAGCKVDFDETRVWFPRQVVEWALQQAPRVVKLGARDHGREVVLDGSRSHHTTDSQGTRVIDPESGELRPSTLRDLERGLIFADALDMVEIVSLMVAASDIPAHLRTLQHFATAFTHTGKPVRTSVLHAGQVPFLVEMVKAVTRLDTFTPIFSTVDCTISPLMHDGQMTEACIELARLRVPIMVYPMPLAGGTSPVTLGGTVLLHNTEFLSGLALFQAASPGAPIIYGTGASQLDMRTGRYGGGANGFGLGPALCAMARHYNLPVNMNGLATSSLALDVQYGHEATAACLLAYLSGADEIFSVGLLGDAQILSLEKMVLDNHMARQIESMVRQVATDEAHLAIDLIARVGIGGHFLGQRETRQYTRTEYIPKWPPADKSMVELARQEAMEILRSYRPHTPPENVVTAIAEILAEADRALKGRD